MQVLVATKRTQGWRSTDHFRALDGELVRLPTDGCGLADIGEHHAAHGVGSRGHTTTFAVVERSLLDAVDYRRILRDEIIEAESFPDPPTREQEEWLAEFIGFHLDIAENLVEGSVLELRGGEVKPRWTLADGIAKG